MTQDTILAIICISASFLGFYIAYLYGRSTRRFRWSEYLAIILIPVLSVLLLAYFYGTRILSLFVVSCIIGTFLEYIVGLVYHKTLSKRLWIYQKFSIQGYTSLLSIPLWGVGGVLAWLIARIIGL